jgi:hypothetical protein
MMKNARGVSHDNHKLLDLNMLTSKQESDRSRKELKAVRLV